MALPNNPTQSEVVKAIKDLENAPAQATDVQVNGTSITSGGVANIVTESAYDASTNKIATKNDIPTKTSDLTNDSGYTTNVGTVTSVGAGTGLSISGTASVNPTVNVASGYKLPTTTEWNAKADTSAVVTSVNGKTGAVTGLATSNPNLLINSNFAINQRGKTSYNAAGYTVDRWTIGGNATLTPNSNGVSITTTSTSTFNQYMEGNFSLLAGKQVALSAKLNNVIYTATATIGSSQPSGTSETAYINKRINENSINGYLKFTWDSGSRYRVYFYFSGAQTVQFNWVKLEVGDIATEYTPPLIAEELPKCQRYFYMFVNGIGVGQSTSNSDKTAIIRASLPVSMRTTPSVTLIVGGQQSAGMQVRSLAAGVQTTVSAITGISFWANDNQMEINVSLNYGITTGAVVDSWLYYATLRCDAEIY